MTENTFQLILTQLDEIQNHEDFIIIWFPSNGRIANEENMGDYLKKFDSLETLNNCIQEVQIERKILLVLTDSFDRLPYFDQLLQIHVIYILNKSTQNIEYRNYTPSKLVDIFTDEYTLIERLRRDILLTYRSDFSIGIFRVQDTTIELSSTILDETAMMFMWNQAFIYYLVNSPLLPTDMIQLKQEMVSQCRLECIGKPHALVQIDNFDKNCTHKNVLEWYTQDSYDKLKQLNDNQQVENYPRIYRGQEMKIYEIQNLISNIGNLITTNTIILFFPFADISEFSWFPEEQETLFFSGSVFRIEYVQSNIDSTWIVKLTLTNETVLLTKHLINIFSKELNYKLYWNDFFTKTYDLILLGKYYTLLTDKNYSTNLILTNRTSIDICYLLNNLGNYENIIEYYKKLLSAMKSIVLNIIIGYDYYHLFEYYDTLY
ncbi:hypothetical protein I4U23_004881 [Adineta vaga]|nr:hypothetical protein I4U23_004881 [Adineta vaga]